MNPSFRGSLGPPRILCVEGEAQDHLAHQHEIDVLLGSPGSLGFSVLGFRV